MAKWRFDGRLAWVLGSLFVALFVATAAAGCSDYSFERNDTARGTLGEELFGVWRKEAVRSPRAAEARTTLLDRRRDSFISAVDTTVPPENTAQFDRFLRGSSYSIDQHHIQPVTKKLRLTLLEASNTPDVLAALDGRGYPGIESYLSDSPSLLAHIAEYDQLAGSLRRLLEPLATSDGWTPDGQPAPDESRVFRGTQRALSDAMRALSQPESRDTVFRAAPVVLRGALLTEQPLFERPETEPLLGTRYDIRGFPEANRGPNGSLPRPLTDNDGDGLADIDEEGRFRLRSQASDTIEPFPTAGESPVDRDELGRAITESGRPVFDYLDLTRTGLFHATGTAADWTAKDIHWEFIDGLPALLGERSGSSRRFERRQPLVNVVHAALASIDVDNIGGVLGGLGAFLRKETPAVAEMSEALVYAADTISETPGTDLGDNQTIDYDLIPLLRELAEDPQLWADVVAALDDPMVRRADDAFARMIRYKNDHISPPDGGAYDQCFQTCKNRGDSQWASGEHPHGIGTIARYQCIRSCPVDSIFQRKTNFDELESFGDRSTAQRLFHLLYGVSETSYSMKVNSPIETQPIFTLDNAAEAFIDSVAQEATLEEYVNEDFSVPLLNLDPESIADYTSTLSTLTGVKLDRRPRPSQITRLFNQEDISASILGFNVDISDPVCKDGYVMARHHADILYAAEASGLVDAIQPLARAFGRHGRNDLFAKFFVVLHRHYSKFDDRYEKKNGEPSPMKGSNFVSLEPALHAILTDGRLFDALTTATRSLDAMDPVDGQPVVEHLRQVVLRATSPLDGPAFDGRTSVTMRDGETTNSPTPLHFLISGVGELADRTSGSPEAEDALGEAASTVASSMFGTVTDDDGSVRLETPGNLALAGLLLADIGDAAALLGDETRHEQFTEAWPKALEDGLVSTNFADVTALLEMIAEDPETRSAVDGLLAHVLNSEQGRRITTAATYRLLVRSTRLATWQPIGRLLADVIDPERRWNLSPVHSHHAETAFLSNVVEFVRDILSRDDENYSQTLVRRALNQTVTTRRGESRSPLGVITNTVSRYFRPEPAATADYDDSDHQRVLREIAEWLGSEDHGMERLYELVGRRAGSDLSPPSTAQ